MTPPEPSRTSTLVSLAAGLALASALVLAPAASAQLSGPTVVQGFFTEEVPKDRLVLARKGRCAGVLAEGADTLPLHCGHNFDEPVTVTVFRAGSGQELTRLEGVTGDFYLDLELTPPVRQDLRRGALGIEVEGATRRAAGDFEPPASAAGSVVRLDVDLVDAGGAVGGSCTTLLLGIGSDHWLFDLYADCAHDLAGPVSAGIFDRNPASRLTRPNDQRVADLGDARQPVLLDWRIGGSGLTPVGAFFGGTLEVVVSGEDGELRATLDGCMSGGEAVCLRDRFQVSTRYLQDRVPGGGLLPARPLTFSGGAALFTFWDPEQVEVMVNLDDRCAETGFYDLRASSASPLRPRVTIVDTLTGEERVVELFRRGARGGPAGSPLSVIERRAFRCQ